ncbi:sorting nexin-29-like [Homalodisca vitripennis]|uniref:sorting nexin-29-like n=1 Tax=Homalodisca vitripennis TaxID=197043 RepID=UPI001EEBAF51|nr:sorting nexin-29-like [Homalodisca vitripennis]
MLPVQVISTGVDACKILQADLLHSVKLCQIRFGGRTELATELDPHVVDVCNRIEAVLSHGLRTKALPKKNHSTIKQVTELVLGGNGQEPAVVFWHFVRDFLTKHERGPI